VPKQDAAYLHVLSKPVKMASLLAALGKTKMIAKVATAEAKQVTTVSSPKLRLMVVEDIRVRAVVLLRVIFHTVHR
jgi:hypothetical protein